MSGEAIALLLLLGASVGLASGIAAAGAPVAVSALVFGLPFLGVNTPNLAKIAAATSLALYIPTGIASLTAHGKRGSIDWLLLLMLAPAVIAGATLAALAAPHIDTSVLAVLFILFALFSAWRLIVTQRPLARQNAAPPNSLLIASRGLFGGVLAALLGIGISVITVPIMARLVSMPRALGTSAAIVLPMAVAGTVGYLTAPKGCDACFGYVYLPAVATMGISAVLAVPLGVWLGSIVPEKAARMLFALVLLAAAGNLGIKAGYPAFAKASHLMALVIPHPGHPNDAPHAATAPVWLGRHDIAQGGDHE
jgi:uncharacterized protein